MLAQVTRLEVASEVLGHAGMEAISGTAYEYGTVAKAGRRTHITRGR